MLIMERQSKGQTNNAKVTTAPRKEAYWKTEHTIHKTIKALQTQHYKVQAAITLHIERQITVNISILHKLNC